MKKFSAKLSTIAVITLIISTIFNSSLQNERIQATEFKPNNDIENTVTFEKQNYEFGNNQVEPQVARVIIFFGTLAVGYVIDGAIHYYTGYSASYWAAQGIGHVHDTIANLPITSNSQVMVYPNGNVQLERCDGSGNCAIPTKLSEEQK